MRLWLARHASPLIAPGLCYGSSDVAADPEHTRDAARRLAAALPALTQLHCSPLRRCRALADSLLAWRPALQVRIDPRLAEMDFGDWEGRSWDTIGGAALAGWTADFQQYRPGGGESVDALMRRVASAWQAAARAGHAGQSDQLWITHAGVIKAARLLAQGHGPVERADQWPGESVGYGAWTVLSLPAPDSAGFSSSAAAVPG